MHQYQTHVSIEVFEAAPRGDRQWMKQIIEIGLNWVGLNYTESHLISSQLLIWSGLGSSIHPFQPDPPPGTIQPIPSIPYAPLNACYYMILFVSVIRLLTLFDSIFWLERGRLDEGWIGLDWVGLNGPIEKVGSLAQRQVSTTTSAQNIQQITTDSHQPNFKYLL